MSSGAMPSGSRRSAAKPRVGVAEHERVDTRLGRRAASSMRDRDHAPDHDDDRGPLAPGRVEHRDRIVRRGSATVFGPGRHRAGRTGRCRGGSKWITRANDASRR